MAQPFDTQRIDTSAQFSVLARADLAASTLVSWAPRLWREPRLLVPVDVAALVVRPAAAPAPAEPVADIARRLPEGAEPPAGSAPRGGTLAAPPPFTDVAARPPGVYLHWALPDALCTAALPQQAGAQDAPTQLGMPVVPNRWLVVRVGGGTPRRTAAWVVESDRGITRALAGWSESATPTAGSRTPWLSPGSLSAVTGGDPAWAAVLDGVVDRFGVHDDLTGLDPQDARATLTYLVAGWYSDPGLDPLFGADGVGGIEALLARLRWGLDPAALARAREQAEASRRAASAARKPSLPRTAGAELSAMIEVGAVSTRVPVSEVSAALVEGGVLHLAQAAWSPRQILCHGAVYGVRPDAAGADDRPHPGTVSVALGSCVEESFAAALARSLPDPLGGERLAAAFLRGTAARYDDPDGAVAVDEDLHGAEFVVLPGGSRERGDRLRTGGPADRVLDALGAAAANRAADRTTPPRTKHSHGSTTSAARFGRERRATHVVDGSVAEAFHETTSAKPSATSSGESSDGRTTGAGATTRAPGGFRDVEVGLPRLHAPADPVLTLVGAGRSLRHGTDTRHTAAGLLACRLTGEPVDAFHGVLRGSDVVAALGHGGVPPECESLLAEVVLADPFHVEETVVAAVAVSPGAPAAVARRVRGEVALAAAASAGHQVGWASTASTMDGALPSPIATTWWRQPWVPLYVEWALELDLPDDDAAALRGWILGEIDLEPGEGPPATSSGPLTLTGRSLLTAGSAATFAARVRTVLESEAARTDGGDLEPATEQALADLAGRSDGLDVTAAALEGLRVWLLGWDDNVARARAGGDPAAPVPARLPRLLRSGAFRLTAARVVDAFGRVLDLGPVLPAARLAGSLTADGAGASGTAGVLVPRLTPPARLLLRLVDPARPDQEAYVDQQAGSVSPIAGWLLPDPVDHAVELFDAAGAALGQLLHDPDGPGVLWESAPGRPGPLGAPPPVRGPADAPLAELVVGLLRADVARRAAGPVAESEDLLEEEESPLSALLRVLDTTGTTVDTAAAGSDHLAALTARPLALVRAVLRLDVVPDSAPSDTPAELRSARATAFAAVARLEVPVRLGALSRTDDGLLGFFVDDDYSRFHPVDGAVLAAALDSGPRRGVLATDGSALDPGTRPVTSPYVVADPVLRLHPGQSVLLTLVVVPGTAVHATCGLLPRTSVRLAREWAATALEVVAPSFRIGPVLVDPATVRLPAPGGGGLTPAWAYRDTPTTWRDDPLGVASTTARLPERPAEVAEGWLRLVRTEDGST